MWAAAASLSGPSCYFSPTLSRSTTFCPLDKQSNVFHGFRNTLEIKTFLSFYSLTKCRRVSSPWSSRLLHSRPTWKGLGRKIRKDTQGPSPQQAGPIHVHCLHRRPRSSVMEAQMMLHGTIIVRPQHQRPSHRWIQTRTPKKTLAAFCVRNRVFGSLRLEDCVGLAKRSDLFPVADPWLQTSDCDFPWM